MMKRLARFAISLLIAYLFCRLLIEYLRPVRLQLEEQLARIPSQWDRPQVSPLGPPPPTAPGGETIDINQATVADLTALPGIGPTLAKRIVDHRERAGLFASLEELTQVKGIGTVQLERIRPLVTV